MDRIYVKKGCQLSNREIDEINKAKAREFHALKIEKSQLKKSLFFLLKDEKNNILSMGELIPIEGVVFKSKTFSILGIGGILSNIKGRGFGEKIMTAIKRSLIKKHKTGIGFCRASNKPFYEKCGFSVDANSINRFVFYNKGKRVVNTGDECVIYLDSDDHLMKKILPSESEEVLLPRPPNW